MRLSALTMNRRPLVRFQCLALRNIRGNMDVLQCGDEFARASACRGRLCGHCANKNRALFSDARTHSQQRWALAHRGWKRHRQWQTFSATRNARVPRLAHASPSWCRTNTEARNRDFCMLPELAKAARYLLCDAGNDSGCCYRMVAVTPLAKTGRNELARNM